jgi:cytochrome oxidase assembly protein ShyY1
MPLVFSLNYRILILFAVLLPVLLCLGEWQLRRAAEKDAIQTAYIKRQMQSPLTFDQLITQADIAFAPVQLRGSYDSGHTFLLDNRVHAGQVGYEVLVPFQLESGEWIILNRGWLKAPALRSELPDIPTLPDSVVELQADVYVPPGEGFQLSGMETSRTEWPRVITVFDSVFMAEQLNRKLFPYQLRLQTNMPGALIIDWPAINVSPEKHRAYALQWFAMAAALLVWLVVASVSIRKKP